MISLLRRCQVRKGCANWDLALQQTISTTPSFFSELADFSTQPKFFPRGSCLVFRYKNSVPPFGRYTLLELTGTSDAFNDGLRCFIAIRFFSDSCDRYFFECTAQPAKRDVRRP